MTCRLAPGSVHSALPKPCATSLTDRVEEDAAPRGFLTGRPLTDRKVTLKHWRKARLSLPLGRGPGLCVGSWHSPRVPRVPRAWSRNAHAFPSSPQDVSQDEGCAPASKQQSHGPAWLEPALGSSAATGSGPAPAALALTPCPTAPPWKAGPREAWHRAVGTQPDFLPPVLLGLGPISAHPPAPGARHGAAQVSRKHMAISRRKRTRRAGAMAPHTRTMLPTPPLQPQ